jgi:aryl-alcohol dehydrogenase-like predicted oxidoreductase
LIFGAMQLGGAADIDAATEMFDACIEAGINHFDTAHVYNAGKSEEILRKLAARERDRLILASKIGYSGGSGSSNMLAQFGDTRRRLGTEAIDVLYLHRFDPETPLNETFKTLASFQSKGQIRYIGVSNFAAWQVMKAQRAAQEQGTRIDIVQPMYSLVKRQAEVEILPMCADQGIAVAAYSPLGGGLLTGKYANASPTGRLASDQRYAARYAQAWMHETAKELKTLAKECGTSPATLAVAWVMSHPFAPHPIISARSVQQLRPSLAAIDFDMTPDLRGRISALARTPPPATDRIEEV